MNDGMVEDIKQSLFGACLSHARIIRRVGIFSWYMAAVKLSLHLFNLLLQVQQHLFFSIEHTSSKLNKKIICILKTIYY